MRNVKQKINLVAKNNTPLNQLTSVYRYWTKLGFEVTITPKVTHG